MKRGVGQSSHPGAFHVWPPSHEMKWPMGKHGIGVWFSRETLGCRFRLPNRWVLDSRYVQ